MWRNPWILAGLAGALVVLGVHIRVHAFLTDDAFIAFRYARNLSHGSGLVFNPGHEAVEGFTSLLWVLVLAALDRIGIAPEFAANALTVVATLVIWIAVVAFCARSPGAGRAPWLVLVPAWGLALHRSFAVWATSGLEARAFEAFLVLGVLRLVDEQEREGRGELVRPVSPWLFALACLTRPEGTLFAAMAVASVVVWRARRGRLDVRVLLEWVPCVVMVAAIVIFRRLYYHEWLPNTWYAKVGGELFWSSGLRYLAAFALEYGAWVWVVLIAIGFARGRNTARGYLLLLAAFVLVPHLVYVVSTGGDHFEYRPLGPEIVLGFVLLHAAGVAVAARRGWAMAWSAAVVVTLVFSTALAWRSHRDFPGDYRTGFPGAQIASPDAQAWLDPDRDPWTRLPGVRRLARAHRDLVRELTARLVAVRQEEHRLFLASVLGEGRELAELVGAGRLPPDVHVAIDCVGAIPYYSGVRTLDRLGLTDARVAHSARAGTSLAHWRFASLDYARERGVDLWARDRVHLICRLDSRPMLRLLGAAREAEPTYAADLGGDRFLLCQLPMGLEQARRRMPRLVFTPVDDPVFLFEFQTRLARAMRDSVERNPDDTDDAESLASLLTATGDFRGAMPVLERLVERGHGSPQVLETLAYCQAQLGLHDLARNTMQRAFAEAARRGDRSFIEKWQARRAQRTP